MTATSHGSHPAAIAAEEHRVEREHLAPRSLERRRVLLVGGAGYIGSELTAHLLEHGYLVRSADLLLYGNGVTVAGFLRHPGYEFRHMDLVDSAAVDAVLDDVTDVIILAGLVGDPITKAYPDASDAINLHGIGRLVDRLRDRGLNKVVFVSTCSNYGMIPDGTVADEGFALKPLSRYATAKVAIEEHLVELAPVLDYRPVVLRFATAFGLSARTRFDLTVNEFTRDLFLRRPLVVYDAHTWRPYCHVRDFAELMRRVLEAPVADVAGEVFNAGGDANNATKATIVDTVLRHLPGREVTFQEHGSDPRNYRVSFAKVRERLGFEPALSIEAGIVELLGALREGIFDDVEDRRAFYGNYELRYPAAPVEAAR